jgi:hypothetical protein
MISSAELTDARAGRFLSEFANCGWPLTWLQARLESLSAFASHTFFSRFMPGYPNRFPAGAQKLEGSISLEHWRLFFWQELLREMWATRPVPHRNAALIALISQYCSYIAGLDEQVSRGTLPQVLHNPRVREAFAADLFLAALIRATNFVSAMKRCSNRKCRQPFFLIERKGQKICLSPECRAWAERKYKRRSWEKHKYEWRPLKAARRSRKSQRKER